MAAQGLGRCDARDFAVGYGADAAALDVVPIGAGRIS
jgi:hypothetical protein